MRWWVVGDEAEMDGLIGFESVGYAALMSKMGAFFMSSGSGGNNNELFLRGGEIS
ncbi:MAG TPA: hypothetical protein PLZ19_06565 [Thermosynergistes sp.]|nr:hypothetical protein [Thermosynergistes sp.]